MAAEILLAALAERPEQAAILLDVDGTLAPIADHPEDARVPDATRKELRRLRDRYGLVACISGRPAPGAARVVGVAGIRYVGEHGLELEPEANAWVGRMRAFAESVEWPAEAGKRLSLSFHYRASADPVAAEAYLRQVAEQASAQGLRPRWGRMVLEVRPPLELDKGTAVRRLLADSGLRRALYAGDDTTDLDAFAALEGLEVAVRVAVASAEAPAELVRTADLAVDGPGALADLLRGL